MTGNPKHLLVLLNQDVIGDLHQDSHGQLSFAYRKSWQDNPSATPLSLSMPLTRTEHSNVVVDCYLRGLLPDSDNVLQRWGRRFGVSPNSPFALLTHVGEDVAGAAQFVAPDRLARATGAGHLEPVDEVYIEKRLRTLRGDRAAWDDATSPGQFSLAGAQAKFALYKSPAGTWAIPTGRAATTHILKPPLADLAHQEVNEHLCLRAAARLGMRTAPTTVETFGAEKAIVITRYDRIVEDGGNVRRVHQEDMCQALSVHPSEKYERGDGGPGMARIVTDLIQRYLDPARAFAATEQLIRALAFNWVIYGPDAHAKNYSLLLAGPRVALAPLYDISSVVCYPDTYRLQTMAMAMSVKGKFQNDLIVGDDWVALADRLRLDASTLLGWVIDVVVNAPAAFVEVIATQPGWIQDLPMTGKLLDGVSTASKERQRYLEPTRPI